MKKKIIYGICMMSLVALVATSCKKKEDTAMKFTAEIMAVEDGDNDRAYLDPNSKLTYWNAGDELKVYNINENDYRQSITQIYTVNMTVNGISSITGGAMGNADVYYAFYPAEMAEDSLLEGNYQKFVIPDFQPMVTNPSGSWTVGGTSLPMAATATRQDPTFHFQHIFGVARFKLTCQGDTDPDITDPNARLRYLKQLVITDNHFHLSGTVTLKPHKLNVQKLQDIMTAFKGGQELQDIADYNDYVLSHTGNGLGYSATGGSNTITYDFSNLNGGKGLQMNSDYDQYANVLVGLRPGALAYGFTLTATIGQDGMDDYDVVISNWVEKEDSKVIEPNKIKAFTADITNAVNAQMPPKQ